MVMVALPSCARCVARLPCPRHHPYATDVQSRARNNSPCISLYQLLLQLAVCIVCITIAHAVCISLYQVCITSGLYQSVSVCIMIRAYFQARRSVSVTSSPSALAVLTFVGMRLERVVSLFRELRNDGRAVMWANNDIERCSGDHTCG